MAEHHFQNESAPCDFCRGIQAEVKGTDCTGPPAYVDPRTPRELELANQVEDAPGYDYVRLGAIKSTLDGSFTSKQLFFIAALMDVAQHEGILDD